MEIYYDGVGGIGLEFTEYMAQQAISTKQLSEEEWEEDNVWALEKLGFKWCRAGVYDTGRVYIFVEGDNLTQINENKYSFINKLASMGTQIQESDLEVISDIWVN